MTLPINLKDVIDDILLSLLGRLYILRNLCFHTHMTRHILALSKMHHVYYFCSTEYNFFKKKKDAYNIVQILQYYYFYINNTKVKRIVTKKLK